MTKFTNKYQHTHEVRFQKTWRFMNEVIKPTEKILDLGPSNPFSKIMVERGLDVQNTDKSIALQIVSGREGISLKEAEILVYYNIDFSATSYWQSRDRMTTKERLKNDVYWIFAKGGIEHDIYESVIKKKDYTLRHFKRDLLTLN